MKTKTILLLFVSILLIADCFAQKEWSNWYKNGRSLVTFKNGVAEIETDFINPIPSPTDYLNFYYLGSGGISYSDPVTGEMKFIISNRYGFNRNYDLFPSAYALRSCPEKLSYHIIPFHNNPDKFYVIQFQDCGADVLQASSGLQVRCPNAIGLGYSIVDLTLDGGLGDFSIMNQVIQPWVTGQMTTVRHSNGKDVWVIVHPWQSDQFRSFLITDAGIEPPVVNHIGPEISGGFEDTRGFLTASHDGKLLAGATSFDALQLFDFDNTTGIISNYRTLPHAQSVSNIQFSPDDSKLYYSSQTTAVYQYDFNSPDLAGSQTRVVYDPMYYLTDMQLAPDGKIYLTRIVDKGNNGYSDYIGVIECPNLPQYACNFNPKALLTSQSAFPDLINDFIIQPKTPLITQLDIGNDTAICFGELTITAPGGWESYRWNTGETSREITVRKAGTYHVLTGNTGFSCPEAYGYINVTDKAIKLDLGPDTTLCPKTPFLIQVNNNYSNVTWENGSHTMDSIISESTTIRISANDRNGCFTNDTIQVSHKYYPKAVFGPDTTLCSGQSLLLQLEPGSLFGPAGVFLWQDGSTSQTYNVTEAGMYWGQSTYDGCMVRDTIRVSYLDAAAVNLGNDTTLCQGDSLVIQASATKATFEWNTGENTPSIIVKNNGTYWVKVNNGSCTLSDTIQITFQPKPALSLGKDTTLCDGQTMILHPGVSADSYLWQDSSTNDILTVNRPGVYWSQVTSAGCSARDSIHIYYNALPYLDLGSDTTICETKTLLLNAAHPSIRSFIWQDGSQQPAFLVSKAGTYFVSVAGVNGCFNKDTVSITTSPLPDFSLGNDTTLCQSTSLLLSSDLAGAKFLWNTGHSENSFSVSQPGTYWLEATQNNCTKRDSILISYKPLPRVFLGNDTTVCEGSPLSLNATYPGATYLWQNHFTGPVLHVTKPGRYIVAVNLDACISKDTIDVIYKYKPAFTLGNDTAICTGQVIVLRPNISAVSYLWQDGSSSPEYRVSGPGTYSLTVTNICGSATSAITFEHGLCELYLPNAFTPNGDGLNDLFRVKYPGFIKTFEMIIYNRFGQVIFKTNDPRIGWDGTFRNELQPAGVYPWKIKLVNTDNEEKSAKGTVSILR